METRKIETINEIIDMVNAGEITIAHAVDLALVKPMTYALEYVSPNADQWESMAAIRREWRSRKSTPPVTVAVETNTVATTPAKQGQIWEPCQCGNEPVYMPLHLCEKCWPSEEMEPQPTITVDSRSRDPKSEMVVKHESLNGTPISHKPIRKIQPDMGRLSRLARFIVEQENGTYIGGFLHRKNDVRVEGPAGSHPHAGDEVWAIPGDARNVCPGYLFPIFEPNDDETEYFNFVARKIEELAGVGGRVVINGHIFEVAA